MKIYTKVGDKGFTSLIGGTKVLKSDLRIEAYGTVDELNAHVGLCKDLIEDKHVKEILLEIQDRLFTIGSTLACDPEKDIKMQLPSLHVDDVKLLEKEIDRMDAELPEMKNFILPGGHETVSQLHIARCVCRRAERCCVRIESGETDHEDVIIQYLNRLSDYLFELGRYITHLLGAEEVVWKARESS
jgi:cob(I)alamin adenosyltransferase